MRPRTVSSLVATRAPIFFALSQSAALLMLASGDIVVTLVLSVPKTKFDNNGGEGPRRPAPMRCGLRAGWHDGLERLCQETDEFSTRCSRQHTSSGSGASALRPGQSHGQRTRDESIRSAFRRSRSAKASLGQSACRGFPWPVTDGSAVDPIPITDQVARSFSPRERLCDLACNPFRGRMGCDVDPDKFSALQSNDDKDIEVEANGRGNEQIDGGNVGCMVTHRRATQGWVGRIA